MKIHDAGDAVYISAEFRDVKGKLKDPTTTCLITIKDDAGTTKVDGQAMTKDLLGRWYYVFQSSAGDRLGEYTVRIAAISGDYTSINEEPLFVLE